MHWIAETPPRHYRVWLNRPLRRDRLKGLDGETFAIAADWFGRDLPAVVRRRSEADPSDAIPLGIALPPTDWVRYLDPLSPNGERVRVRGRSKIIEKQLLRAIHRIESPSPPPGPLALRSPPRGRGSKNAIPISTSSKGRRVALSVPACWVREILPPLALAQVIPSAPPAWRAPLAELNSHLIAAGLSAHVYGSLAWQHITGEHYLTARSDVDLLLRPQNRSQLEQALSLLQDWERHTRLRADGEFQLSNGAAVAWRELLSAPDRVLVKTAQAVRLYPLAELFAAIEPGYASATP